MLCDVGLIVPTRKDLQSLTDQSTCFAKILKFFCEIDLGTQVIGRFCCRIHGVEWRVGFIAALLRHYGLGHEHIDLEYARYESVTPADIGGASRKYLTAGTFVLVGIRPPE